MKCFAEDLRASVLQFAIEGKLSDQRDSDTPVDETLKRLLETKEKLLEQKAIKITKQKLPNEQQDFRIPSAWRWIKLTDIGELSRGRSKHRPRNDQVLYIDGTVPFIQTGDVASASKYIKSWKSCYNETGVAQSRLWKKGTICITIAANIGDAAILNFDACFPDSVVGFLPFTDEIDTEYILYMLMAYKFRMNKKATKMAQSNLSLDRFGTLLFPLPPREEQKRIVERLNEILDHIDDYARMEKKLIDLKTAFPDDMRDAILQAAMQGKLTEQREDDGTAIDFLKEIAAEKNRLIKEGKIKKEKNLPLINETEVPFDIPKSWEWIRLGDAISLLSGSDLPSDQYNDDGKGMVYITGASNIENNEVIVNRWTMHPKSIARKGDILLTCKGTVGTTCFLKLDEAHIARQIMAIRCIKIDSFFVRAFLMYYVSSLKRQAKSMIPGIERKTVNEALLPLPTLAEQRRIVSRLNELLPLCDELEGAL